MATNTVALCYCGHMTETRSETIKFRATTEEKERIEVLAEEFGQRTSDYVRTCSLVGPTPSQAEVDEIEESGVEAPGIASTEAPQDFVVPDDASREAFIQFLYERNTELHRDKQKRWPGVLARRKAGEEWKLVREGKLLEKIEPREMRDALIVTPTTYRTA